MFIGVNCFYGKFLGIEEYVEGMMWVVEGIDFNVFWVMYVVIEEVVVKIRNGGIVCIFFDGVGRVVNYFVIY